MKTRKYKPKQTKTSGKPKSGKSTSININSSDFSGGGLWKQIEENNRYGSYTHNWGTNFLDYMEEVIENTIKKRHKKAIKIFRF